MKYRLDNYVVNEVNGFIRLLFEADDSYFYVWLRQDFVILAVQIIIRNSEAIIYKAKSILEGELSQIPFNRSIAISNKSNLEKINIIEVIENDNLPILINKIKLLFHKKKCNPKLDKKEIELISKMPASKQYKTKDALTRRSS